MRWLQGIQQSLNRKVALHALRVQGSADQPHASKNPGIRFEILEPRILLSADPFSAAVAGVTSLDDGSHDAFDFRHSEELSLDQILERLTQNDAQLPPPLSLDLQDDKTFHAEVYSQASSELLLDAASHATPSHDRLELIFVDAGIDNVNGLLDSFVHDPLADYQLIMIDPGADGFDLIASTLQGFSGVDAVHIIGHGEQGTLTLGSSNLNADKLERYSTGLTSWGRALAEDADILIYACNVGGNAAGLELLDSIAGLTGADISASNDLSGAVQLRGDWELEVTTGAIETDSLLRSGSAWEGVLATFTVDTTADTVDDDPGDGVAEDDDGNTSLRAAIMEANALGGSHTIILPAGTYTLNASAVLEDFAASGDLDIRVDITIDGAGSGTTTIDGNGADRVFSVTGSTDIDFVLNGVTVTGGNTDFDGGGIRVATGNTFTAEDIVVTGNQAERGGGIYSNGTVNINNATLSSNVSIDEGGGYYNDVNGTATLSNTTISNHTSTSINQGSGIYNDGSIDIADSSFENNGRTNGPNGGGLYNAAGGDATLTNTSFTENNSNRGGGIYNYGTATLTNVVFTDNGDGETDRGGGFFNRNSGAATMSQVIFTGNDAILGGAIYNNNVLDINEGIFTDNGSVDTDDGGAIYNNDDLEIDRVTFSGNQAVRGGGIFHSGNTLNIENSTFSGNSASDRGGGIRVGGNAVILNSTFTLNDATNNGGGIKRDSGTLSIQNTIVSDNTGGTPDVDGDVSSLGYNLIEDATDSSGWVASDISGESANLGALTDNGGFGKTHMPNSGSSAIDPAGLTGAPANDQTNTARDATPDIGAVEFVSTNNDPTLENPISDQNTLEDDLFSFQFAANTFDDADGDALSYSALLSGGLALPDWLTFTSADQTFSGTPLDGDTGSLTIVVTADDENGGTPATDTFNLTITNVNDEPTLTANQLGLDFTENAGAVALFGSADVDTIESGQNLIALTITVDNVDDGDDEQLNIDSAAVILMNGAAGTTTSFNYNVSVSGTTATVSLTGGSITRDAMETLIDNITYQNNSDDPDITNKRIVTVTVLQDDGGTDDEGDDTASPGLATAITLFSANDQPSVGDIAHTATEDGGASGGNFTVSDPDSSDTHVFTITVLPAEGHATTTSGSGFNFLPQSDFQDLGEGETRDVTFQYTATDNSGAANDTSDPGTVTVTVTGVNDRPIAGAVTIDADEDGAVVTDNFSLFDADTNDDHIFTITSQPAEGSAVNNNDGSFDFDPETDFQDLAEGETRDVTINYTVTDDSGTATDTSTVAAVTVTVTGVNDRPVAGAVAVNADEDGATVNGSFSETDADTTDTHSFAITSAPTEGSVINNGDGTFTFDPEADFQDLGVGDSRDVTFNYTAIDDSGTANDTSVAQTVTVTVEGANDRPSANAVAINADEDGATINGSFSETDVDTNDTHIFTITSAPAEGSVVNNNDGTFTFDPGTDFQDLAEGETRDVSFQYTATDDSGAGNATSVAATVTVTVTGTNEQPVAGNVDIDANEDGLTVNGNFSVSDDDAPDDHTFAINSAPAEGSVINNNDGTFSFDPETDFQDLGEGETRDVNFTYTATDDSGAGNATSANATVTVTVTGINDQPVANAVAANATEDAGSSTDNFAVSDVDSNDNHSFSITSTPAEGSVLNNNDGTFSFDPGTDFQDLGVGDSRDVTFSFTATDDSGASNNTSAANTITVTVSGANDQPIAGAVDIDADEDGLVVNGNFAETDVDTNDTHTFDITSAPAEGSVVNNNDGTFSFDPDSDFQDLSSGATRDVTFNYTVSDDSGAGNDTSVSQTVTVTVTGVNDQPVSQPVSSYADEDGSVITDSFAVNDVDSDDAHSFAFTSAPAEGSIVNNNDGTFSFDPGGDFQDLGVGDTRVVTIDFNSTDDSGEANALGVGNKISVTVSGVNDRPVADAVALGAVEDGGAIVGNFSASDVDTLDNHSFSISSAPAEGSVVNNNDGSFSFDPDTDFQDLGVGESRDVTFDYTAIDDSGAANNTSVANTVTITVDGINDQPVANAVSDTVFANSPATVIAFDGTDVDDTDSLTYLITSVPAEGTVVNNGDGTFSFDPDGDFADLTHGAERDAVFTYTATDDSGAGNAVSLAGTITITVTGDNIQPVAGAVSLTVSENSSGKDGNFSVTDGDAIDSHTFTLLTNPATGTVINNNDGSFTYDPAGSFESLGSGESASVSFQYFATDDVGAFNSDSNPALVTIDIEGKNDAPVVSSVFVTAFEDGGSVNGSFVVSDVDVNDNHSFTIIGSPGGGTIVNNNNGSFSFDPGSGFQSLGEGETQNISIAYIATDDSGAGNADSDSRNIVVTVTGSNDRPVISDGSISAIEDGPAVTGSFSVSDPDSRDNHRFVIINPPSEGSISVNNNSNSFTFDPGNDFQDLAEGETRTVSFDYQADDGSGAANERSETKTITITVTGTNDSPTVADVSLNAMEDGNSVGASFAVSDVDTNDSHRFEIQGSPGQGQVNNNGDGSFSYSPGDDFQQLGLGETQTISLSYKAVDDSGAANDESDSGVITITISGSNDRPVVNSVSVSGNENQSSISGSFSVNDVDQGDNHSYSLSNLPDKGNVSLSGNGFSFSPGSDFDYLPVGSSETVSFSYSADDGNGASNSVSAPATVSVTINGSNDSPVVSSITLNANEDGGAVIATLPVDDPDNGDSHNFQLTGSPGEGALTLNGGDKVVFDPGSDFQELGEGQTTTLLVNYIATDSTGAQSISKPVSITVTGSNDQPLAMPISVTALEDGIAVEGEFAHSDVDSDDSHQYIIESQPAEGTVTNLGGGRFLFDPGEDFQELEEGDVGVVTFSYRVVDNSGAANASSDLALVTVFVGGEFDNERPVVSALNVSAVEDGEPTSGEFIVSDTDVADTHTFTVLGVPAEGSVSNLGDGVFSFDPGNDFQDLAVGETRDVSFSYIATDSSATETAVSTPATVTVTVSGSNDQPLANGVSLSVQEDGQAVSGSFSASDVDFSDSHQFTIVSQPDSGSVSSDGESGFTYDPGDAFQDLAEGEQTTVRIDYIATDSSGAANSNSEPASIVLTVTGVNDQPVALDVSLAAIEDAGPVSGQFLAEDPDSVFTPQYSIVSQPTEGSVSNNGDGSFNFDPGTAFQDLAEGESRSVSFSYLVDDGSGANNASSETATVTVTVTGVNDQPVADALALSVEEDGLAVIGTFAATDIDSGDSFSYEIVSGVEEGVLVNNGDGTFSFDPGTDFQELAAGETRELSFSYVALDDSGTENAVTEPQTVTITVSGNNDQPVVDALRLNAEEDGEAVTGQFVLRDIDGQDTHSFTVLEQPQEGQVINHGDGSFSFVPGTDFQDLAEGEVREVSFTFIGTDSSRAANAGSEPQTITISVTGANDDPLAENIVLSAAEDAAPVVGNFAGSDIDNGNVVSYEIVSQPQEGLVSNNGDGTFSFDPGTGFQDLAEGEVRSVSFEYRAIDDSGGDNAIGGTATITVDVVGRNDTAIAEFISIAAEEDGATLVSAFIASDADANTGHVFTLLGQPAEGQLLNNGDGTFNFIPGNGFQDLAEGEQRTLSVDYAVSEQGSTEQTTATLEIVITGVNDAPELSRNLSDLTAMEDDAVQLELPGDSFTDIDNSDQLQYTLTAADGGALPAWLQFDPQTLTISGTPGQDDVGNISLVLNATDGKAESISSNVFSLQINNANDEPEGEVSIEGSGQLNTELVAQVNVEDEDGVGELTYQWQRDGVDIVGAVESTYTVSVDDVGASITVQVGYNDDFGTAESLVSDQQEIVNVSEAADETSVVETDPVEETVIEEEPETIEEVVQEQEEETEEDEEASVSLPPAIDIAPVSEEREFDIEVDLPEEIQVTVLVESLRDETLYQLDRAAGTVDSLVGALVSDVRAQASFNYDPMVITRLDSMQSHLDELREEIAEAPVFVELVTGGAMTLTAGLSAGYIAWLARGGVLLSSMLSSLPVWQFVDPLPVLGHQRGTGNEDDESLESLVSDSGDSGNDAEDESEETVKGSS